MTWGWRKDKDNVPYGEDVLIQQADGQFMAGCFRRSRVDGKTIPIFRDSSGAWTVDMWEIQRWVVIE